MALVFGQALRIGSATYDEFDPNQSDNIFQYFARGIHWFFFSVVCYVSIIFESFASVWVP